MGNFTQTQPINNNHYIEIINYESETEINFWKVEIERIKNLSKEETINALISSMKINQKINAIKKIFYC